MLQQPAQKIVTNPLSTYSRPRQSLVHSSPARQRREDFPEVHSPPEKQPWEDFAMMDAYQAEAMLSANDDKDPEADMFKETIREPSPSRVVESPVSFNAKHSEMQGVPTVETKASPDANSKPVARPAEHTQTVPLSSSPENGEFDEQTEGTQVLHVKDPHNDDASTSKDAKKPKKRFTFTQGLFDSKNKHKNKDQGTSSTKVLEKNRRNTVSFTKSTDGVDITTNGMEANGHEENDGLMNGHSSDSAGNEDFPSNPAVRPLSSGSDSIRARSRNASMRSLSLDDADRHHRSNSPAKAKSSLTPLSIPSRPVYGRCACCGKLKRPAGGYASGLSPVLENEHIRSNFSFEAQRNNVGSASSSQDKKRHTAIIPMEIHEGDAETGSIRTVQASIAHYDPSLRSSSRISSDTSMSGAIGEKEKKRRSESATESRMVRFSSLHGLNALDQAHSVSRDGNEVIEDSTPVVERNGKMERDTAAQQGLSRPDAQISSQYSSPMRPDSGYGFRQNQSSQPIEAAPQPTNYRKSMPKQDVINVVGWDKGRRADDTASPVDNVTPQTNGETIEPNDSASAVMSPASPTKETSKEDKKKSRVSGILKVLQPRAKEPVRTLSEEETETKMKVKKTHQMNMTSPTEAPQGVQVSGPQMSPTNKENHQPAERDQPEQTSVRQSEDVFTAKFSQNEAQETKKKGHAPQLSLHLDGDEGWSMGLPEPNLGPHFARSSNTLRDLVIPNGEKTLNRDRTPERDMERMLYHDSAVSSMPTGHAAATAYEKATGGMHGKVEEAIKKAEENEMDKHRGKVAAESGVLEKKYLKTKNASANAGATPWFGIGDQEKESILGPPSPRKSRESVMKNMATLDPGVFRVKAR